MMLLACLTYFLNLSSNSTSLSYVLTFPFSLFLKLLPLISPLSPLASPLHFGMICQPSFPILYLFCFVFSSSFFLVYSSFPSPTSLPSSLWSPLPFPCPFTPFPLIPPVSLSSFFPPSSHSSSPLSLLLPWLPSILLHFPLSFLGFNLAVMNVWLGQPFSDSFHSLLLWHLVKGCLMQIAVLPSTAASASE